MVDKASKQEKDKKEKAGNAEKKEKKVAKVSETKKVEASQKEAPKTPADLSITTPKKKSLRRRHVARAQAHILCSYNNTVVTISDLNGNVLGWASSGSLGFKGPKKSTPFAATLVAQKVVEKTARYNVKEVEIYIKGVGGGREASVRALSNAGLLINSIKDVTPVPHNGCRPKKPRRV